MAKKMCEKKKQKSLSDAVYKCKKCGLQAKKKEQVCKPKSII
jgi:hypothetical protein